MNPRATAMISTRLIGLVLLPLGMILFTGQVLPLVAFMRWINWDRRAIFANLSGGAQFGLSARTVGIAAGCTALGWYLLFRGRRVHAWLLAGLGSQCERCGYDL